jgi:hypothetical protein
VGSPLLSMTAIVGADRQLAQNLSGSKIDVIERWRLPIGGSRLYCMALSHLVLLPLRDTLSFALWGWSFAPRRVRRRDDHFHVTRDGSVQSAAGVSQ